MIWWSKVIVKYLAPQNVDNFQSFFVSGKWHSTKGRRFPDMKIACCE